MCLKFLQDIESDQVNIKQENLPSEVVSCISTVSKVRSLLWLTLVLKVNMSCGGSSGEAEWTIFKMNNNQFNQACCRSSNWQDLRDTTISIEINSIVKLTCYN